MLANPSREVTEVIPVYPLNAWTLMMVKHSGDVVHHVVHPENTYFPMLRRHKGKASPPIIHVQLEADNSLYNHLFLGQIC